jgi:mevalonate pyrophosphate decarboxylase
MKLPMNFPIAGLASTAASVAALVAALAAMTVTAQAQQGNQMGAASSVGQHAAAASAKGGGADESKVKANDKAYNAALRNLPDKQYDPWRGVR